MKIFFSHTQNDKPIVQQLIDLLPPHLSSWVDQRNLQVGGDLAREIRRAIISEVDLMVVFLSRKAIASEWVKNELGWAKKREQKMNRVFLIPIVFGRNFEPKEVANRLYIRCYDRTEVQIRAVADQLYREVVKLAFKTLVKYESRKKYHKTQPSKLALFAIGKWSGYAYQNVWRNSGPRKYQVEMTIAQFRNQLVGEFVCYFPDATTEFRFTGSLSYDRFLQIQYSSVSPGAVQLGSVLYTIDTEEKRLAGKFIGYAPVTQGIVDGHTCVTKVASAADGGDF